MGIRTLVSYWFGNRRAIEQIAATRSALWLGLLFVLAAGFAREYDGQYLLRQPWHVLIPLPVSLGLALIFLALFRLSMGRNSGYPGFAVAFPRFLTVFWMAAPLAFLYAIPYEQLLSAPNSVRANLWTLGIVVVWRVLLMARIAQVLFGASFLGAVCVMMLIGNAAAFIASANAVLPLLNFMGGVRLTDSEEVVIGTANVIATLSFWSAPLWLAGVITVFVRHRWRWLVSPTSPSGPVSIPLWTAAAVSLLVWVFVLPLTQPRQRLRWEVEHLLRDQQTSKAVALMSRHSPSDFPPHWDPPPGIFDQDLDLNVLDILETVVEQQAPEWVRKAYVQKFWQITAPHWDPSDHDWPRIERLLTRLPEGPELRETYEPLLEEMRDLFATSRPSTQLSGDAP